MAITTPKLFVHITQYELQKQAATYINTCKGKIVTSEDRNMVWFRKQRMER